MLKTISTKNKESFIILNKVEICIFENQGQADSLKNNLITPKKQINGNNIIQIKNEKEELFGVDGLLTEDRSISLGIRTSDCAAICFSDGKKIGVIHVGWRGIVNGIIYKALDFFDKENLVIYVSPFLHSFEIKRDFCYQNVNNVIGDKFFEEKKDKIYFNFKDALESILPDHTIWDDRNTKDDLSLPSYRRGDKYNFVTAVSFCRN
jgi:copper oxidase (laccase) domain-containing protein